MNHSEDDVDSHNSAQPEEPTAVPDLTFISPFDCQREAPNHSGSPGEVRSWLTSFEPLKPGTDVSVRFRITETDLPSKSPYTLIPLLTSWLKSWFEGQGSGTAREYDSILWLLKYVRDYINLGHYQLNQLELEKLCSQIIDICTKTNKQGDINESMEIFYAIISKKEFPQQCLLATISMFCTATVILEKVPARLGECVLLLSSGDLGAETAKILEHMLSDPRLKENPRDVATYLTPARGAARHLMTIIETRDTSGDYVVELEALLDAARSGADSEYIRLRTEVISLCTALLMSSRVDEVLLHSELFESVLRITDTCMQGGLVHDAQDDYKKREERYLRDRNTAFNRFRAEAEKLLPKMSERHKVLFQDLLWTRFEGITSSQLEWMLKFAKAEKFCLPGDEKREAKLLLMIPRIIQNQSLPSAQRVQAIDICAEAVEYAVANSSRQELNSSMRQRGMQTAETVLSALLQLVPVEINTSAFQSLMRALISLAACTPGDYRYPLAPRIVETLLSFVTSSELDENISDAHILLGAQAVRTIFLAALGTNAKTAVQAFEALLEIASAKCHSRRSRLAALRVLFRLRCDSEGVAFVDPTLNSVYMASALCRTEEASSTFTHDSSSTPRNSMSSSTSGAQSTVQTYLWMYPDEFKLISTWDTSRPSVVKISEGWSSDESNSQYKLKISNWLFVLIQCLQAENDWETYSFAVVHLGTQLLNMKLFSSSLEAIVQLRKVVCDQVRNGQFKEPPLDSGLKKSDVALCLFHILSRLIPYANVTSTHIQIEGFGNDLVRAFMSGIAGQWEGTARGCIHALSMCCFETPSSIASEYPSIVDKMSKSMTQSHLVVHILEFLAQVARLPNLHSNFTEDEIKMIFGMCIQFLERTRDKHASAESNTQRSTTPIRHSGLSLRRPPFRAAMLQEKGLPQYSAALAYHTMIFWFLSLNLTQRSQYVSFIVPRLVWKNSKGEDTIDEQSEVFIDMMQRTAFSDLGETARNENFASPSDGEIRDKSWIVGLSVITAETAGRAGRTQITKRQACGTTHAIYQQFTSDLPPHHVPSHTEIRPEVGEVEPTSMLPSHVLLQMIATAAPTNIGDLPIALPRNEDFVTRGLNAIDRIATVDSNFIGVLYVAENQTDETQYLANSSGSPDYEAFLKALGTTVSLEPPLHFNPHGMSYEIDGTETIAWRDRVNEIVYCVPTMMASMEGDSQNVNKKAHVGNCFVVVVFNESGLTWKMENLSSQVTAEHIVISPVNRRSEKYDVSKTHEEFFRVEVLTKDEYQNLSAAADTVVVSKDTLAPFVRLLALNANISSMTQRAVKGGDDEYPSSWRARLQAIKRLKAQVQARGRESKEETLALRLDFGRWA